MSQPIGSLVLVLPPCNQSWAAGPDHEREGVAVGDRSAQVPDDGPSCRCREWVSQELARFRRELAGEVRTGRLRVGAGTGPEVLVEAGEQVAVVRVAAADGRVSAEIVVSAGEAEDHAGFSLTAMGDQVAVLSVVSPHAHEPAGARLVFDRPRSEEAWTVVDAEGLNLER